MTSWILPIIVGVIGFLLTGVTVILAFYFSREQRRLDVEPNAPIMNMVMRKQFTEGHCSGIVKTFRQNKNGTHFVQVYPIDKKQGVGEPLPKLYQFVVSDSLIKHYARGEYSDNREMIQILPRSHIDLPKKMRDDLNDVESELMTKEGQIAHVIKQIKPSLITSGDEAIASLLKEANRTGVSKSTFAQIRENNAEQRKLLSIPEVRKEEEKK